MSNAYQVKRLEVEKMRVAAAMGEMELKVLDRKQDIDNLEKQIENQKVRIEQLNDELSKLIKE